MYLSIKLNNFLYTLDSYIQIQKPQSVLVSESSQLGGVSIWMFLIKFYWQSYMEPQQKIEYYNIEEKMINKLNTNNTTASYIFSDVSRALHRQENLSRRLKHLIAENSQLQNKIKTQEEEIKDERKVIIYQINQLTKSVAAKLENVEDKKLMKNMFSKEEQAHCILQELMEEFEIIEKQEKMVGRTHQNIEKMKTAYDKHSTAIDELIKQSTETNEENQSRLNTQIQNKRVEIGELRQENEARNKAIENMEKDMMRFTQQTPQLEAQERELMEVIAKHERILAQKQKKCEQMEKWAEIVIDKKKRKDLYDRLQEKTKHLDEIDKISQQVMIKLIEEAGS